MMQDFVNDNSDDPALDERIALFLKLASEGFFAACPVDHACDFGDFRAGVRNVDGELVAYVEPKYLQ